MRGSDWLAGVRRGNGQMAYRVSEALADWSGPQFGAAVGTDFGGAYCRTDSVPSVP